MRSLQDQLQDKFEVIKCTLGFCRPVLWEAQTNFLATDHYRLMRRLKDPLWVCLRRQLGDSFHTGIRRPLL